LSLRAESRSEAGCHWDVFSTTLELTGRTLELTVGTLELTRKLIRKVGHKKMWLRGRSCRNW
jgi:hypothetical protein